MSTETMPEAPCWDDTVAATAHQVSTKVGDEVAILGLDKGLYYGLNPTGARIWELLSSPIRVSEIHRLLVEEYEVEAEPARRDLLEVLAGLLQAGLIEVRGAGAP
jgi:hypothetical protein